jgi:hypothetical protein
MSTGGKKRIASVRKALPRQRGWSDPDALQALDRRTQFDSPDGSLDVWQDQGGVHLQLAPGPIFVKYTPSDGESDPYFTIDIVKLRWAFENAGAHSEIATDPTFQGYFPDVSWTFNDGDTTIEIGYAPVFDNNTHSHRTATYELTFTDPDDLFSGEEDTGKTNLAGTGAWTRLATITLGTGGEFYITNDLQTPHVIIRTGLPADETELLWDAEDGEVRIYNLDDADPGEQSLSLPVDSPSDERLICIGYKRNGTKSLGYDDDEDWLSDPMPICRLEIAEDNALDLIQPMNRRIHVPPWSSQIVVAEIEYHNAGDTAALVSVWRGSYYADDEETVNPPDATSVRAVVIQLHASHALRVGRKGFARVVGGKYELIPWTWQ